LLSAIVVILSVTSRIPNIFDHRIYAITDFVKRKILNEPVEFGGRSKFGMREKAGVISEVKSRDRV